MRVLIIGGSDAGIEAGLSAAAAGADVTLLIADAFPNFSVCGIPYYLSGEVDDWRRLAHRDLDALQAAGLDLRLNTSAVRIEIADRLVQTAGPDGEASFGYDRLIVATGAVPALPPIGGLDQLGRDDGVHVLHSMGDTLALADTLARDGTLPVAIVGGGYIGLEMAEALTRRGVAVTIVEALPQLMSTVDPEIAAEVRQTLERHGVRVHTETPVRSITRHGGALTVHGEPGGDGAAGWWPASAVLVVTGVRPNTDLAAAAGLTLGIRGAIAVDRGMRTNVPDVFAAGDCVHTYHRLLEDHAYLPLGSTAHKQGRVAGLNAVRGDVVFAGSLGTQVVRVFDRVVAATGLRAGQARQAGFDPIVVEHTADDHTAYYPGATPLRIRLTGDRRTGRLLGAQLLGHHGAEVAKRVDILATAISYGATVADLPTLDLSYTPPLGSPFDALQHAADAWTRARSEPAAIRAVSS
jgi:NADPH-dependent 2,4-dienoyl-CoA reductase/sulfur reductase-like enzyme